MCPPNSHPHRRLPTHAHHVNLLAVLVSAIAAMLIGFLWYSPVLFAKPWIREMGYDPADSAKMREMRKAAGPAYGASFLAAILTAFILGLFLHWMRVADSPNPLHLALGVAIHAWLGFTVTVQLTGALFTRQSMKLFAINTLYQLLSYLTMGAILISWK